MSREAKRSTVWADCSLCGNRRPIVTRVQQFCWCAECAPKLEHARSLVLDSTEREKLNRGRPERQ